MKIVLVKSLLIFLVVIFISSPASYALEGLARLQKAALSDQSTECMVHEYTRRYNEVLRGFSLMGESWDAEMADTADEKAMRWVKDVWKYADHRIVNEHIESREFLSAIENFQESQRRSYSRLKVVR